MKLKQYLNNKISLTIGQLSVEGNKIFVECSGIILCLDTRDGSLIWKNELKGSGYNFFSIANTGNEAVSAAADSAAAAGTVSYSYRAAIFPHLDSTQPPFSLKNFIVSSYTLLINLPFRHSNVDFLKKMIALSRGYPTYTNFRFNDLEKNVIQTNI